MKLYSIILTSLILHVVHSLESMILSDLSKADQLSLAFINEMSNIIQSQRKFQGETFQCLTILPSNLTKNSRQKVIKLNVTTKFQNSEDEPIVDKNKKIAGFYEDYVYDKILDLLHGSCAIHETNEFLYEYCHKEHVRQFDSIFTKERMAKQKFEDIYLGYFNYQSAIQNSNAQSDKQFKAKNQEIQYTQQGILNVIENIIHTIPHLSDDNRKELKSQIQKSIDRKQQKTQQKNNRNSRNKLPIKVQQIPTISTIQSIYNQLIVGAVVHKEYYMDQQIGVIRLNYPIINTKNYYTQSEITYDIECQYEKNGIMNDYFSTAKVISPFDLAFLGDSNKCQKISKISVIPIEVQYKIPIYLDRIKGFQHFLYGQIDQTCTNNWDWKNKNQDNFIEEGTTLLLGVTFNNSGEISQSYFPVTVTHIISPGVIKIQQNLKEYMGIQNYHNLEELKIKYSTRWIHSCRMISKSPIDYQTEVSAHQFINNKLMNIKQFTSSSNQKISSKQPGDQMLCLCRFEKFTEEFLEMPVQLGNKVWEYYDKDNNKHSVFEYYSLKSVKTYSQNEGGLNDICLSMICYDIKKNSDAEELNIQINQNAKSEQSFTQITKLNSKFPIMQFSYESFDLEHLVLLINVVDYGLVKIETQTEKGEKYTYLISKLSILKIRYFVNGSLEIEKENTFYENVTQSFLSDIIDQTLVIHKGFLFRLNDKIIFPRMSFSTGEKIVKFENIKGISYIRKWDISKMKNQDPLLISKVEKIIEQHYQIKKYPIYQQQSIDNQNTQELINSKVENQIPQQSANNFKQIDFQDVSHQPLNRSVSLKYQYFHGQLCGAPINKNRRTNVEIFCGESWMKLEQVSEISPCVYDLRISTKLLCDQNFKRVVEKYDKLSLERQIGQLTKISQIKKQNICYPENSWDNVNLVYDLDTKDVLYEGP